MSVKERFMEGLSFMIFTIPITIGGLVISAIIMWDKEYFACLLKETVVLRIFLVITISSFLLGFWLSDMGYD